MSTILEYAHDADLPCDPNLLLWGRRKEGVEVHIEVVRRGRSRRGDM